MTRRYTESEARELWDDKFTFFWYNEKEIFRWTQEDFDSQARKMRTAGITWAMTFSVTHFRWSFLPWKDKILEALRKLCIACHRENIKVIEHHSSHLNYRPANEKQWENLRQYFRLHDSTFEGFGDIRAAFTGDPLVDGVPFTSLFQIDGRTGAPAETGYLGRALCFNNPHYRKAYFDYLAEIAGTGVDAVLADDVQYFGDGNACTCPWCRNLFREETGIELPPPEKWRDFGNNFSCPEFIEWRRFRSRSTQRFQEDLTELFKKLCISPWRANYRSSLLGQDTTANTFTASLDCWAHIFQENMYSSVIKVNWPVWACEAALQYSLGRRKNSPSMSLFYPSRSDQYYFAWALAESWGQLPFLCPEGTNLFADDQRFNHFEMRHADLYRQVKKFSEAVFLMSRETLDYTSESYPKTSNPLRALMQGAYLAGIGIDMLSEDEDIEAFLAHKILFCCGIRRVLPELLEKLNVFADNGGKAVIIGDFAVFDPPAGAENFLSRKEVVRISSVSGENMYPGMTISRMYGNASQQPAPQNTIPALLGEEAVLVRSQLPRPPFVDRTPPGWLVTAFRPERREKTIVLHLLNVEGLLPTGGTNVSHEDIIRHFSSDSIKNQEPVVVVLNHHGFTAARICSPEFDGGKYAKIRQIGDKTEITVPRDTAAGYLLVELSESKETNTLKQEIVP